MKDDLRVIQDALGALEALGPSAQRAVVEAVRARANAETLGVIIEALASPTARVREVAASALRGNEGLAPCVRFVTQLSARRVEDRRAAAAALEDIRDPHTLRPLIRALHDPDEAVCAAATRALEALRDARAIAPLEEVLARGRWRARKSAVLVLASLDPLGIAAAPIARALLDHHSKVRAAAADALRLLCEVCGPELIAREIFEPDAPRGGLTPDLLAALARFDVREIALLLVSIARLTQAPDHIRQASEFLLSSRRYPRRRDALLLLLLGAGDHIVRLETIESAFERIGRYGLGSLLMTLEEFGALLQSEPMCKPICEDVEFKRDLRSLILYSLRAPSSREALLKFFASCDLQELIRIKEEPRYKELQGALWRDEANQTIYDLAMLDFMREEFIEALHEIGARLPFRALRPSR